MGRVVNREALLAQTHGVPATTTCNHCVKGEGPFTVCVVVPGHLNGSCAGCHYNSSGVRCSLQSGKLALIQLQVQKLKFMIKHQSDLYIAGTESTNRKRKRGEGETKEKEKGKEVIVNLGLDSTAGMDTG